MQPCGDCCCCRYFVFIHTWSTKQYHKTNRRERSDGKEKACSFCTCALFPFPLILILFLINSTNSKCFHRLQYTSVNIRVCRTLLGRSKQKA